LIGCCTYYWCSLPPDLFLSILLVVVLAKLCGFWFLRTKLFVMEDLTCLPSIFFVMPCPLFFVLFCVRENKHYENNRVEECQLNREKWETTIVCVLGNFLKRN
jgi:hypothetical protein